MFIKLILSLFFLIFASNVFAYNQAHLNRVLSGEKKLLNLDLRNADLSGEDLSIRRFENVDLSGANLSSSDCSESVFLRTKLNNVNARLAKFQHTHIELSPINNAIFVFTNFEKATFNRSSGSNVNFQNANLNKTMFAGSKLRNSTFKNNQFNNGYLFKANFEGSTFYNVSFINVQLRGTLFNNVKSMIEVRANFIKGEGPSYFQNFDLRKVDFSNSAYMPSLKSSICDMTKFRNLKGVELFTNRTRFTAADFTNSKINHIQENYSRFSRAIFTNVEFDTGFFSQSKMVGVNMRGVKLKRHIYFGNSDLRNADFTGAYFNTDYDHFKYGTDVSYAKIPVEYKKYMKTQDIKGFSTIKWIYKQVFILPTN